MNILMQGPIIFDGSTVAFESNLDRVLFSVPGVNVTVSTWYIDKVIIERLLKRYPQVKFMFDKEPEQLVYDQAGEKYCSNVNRLVKSTVNGLLAFPCNEIILKIRTDSYINDKLAFDRYDEVEKECFFRDEKYKLFDKPVINCNLFIRNPRSHYPFLYHMGDIMMIGYRDDLLKLFDIPLADGDLFKYTSTYRNTTYFKYVPEQYIFISALNKFGYNISFDENFIFDKKMLEISDKFLINNFIFMSCKQLNFVWPKYSKKYAKKGWSSTYDFNDWLALFNLYYNLGYKVDNRLIVLKKIMYSVGKIYFVFRTAILKNKQIRKIAYRLFVSR